MSKTGFVTFVLACLLVGAQAGLAQDYIVGPEITSVTVSPTLAAVGEDVCATVEWTDPGPPDDTHMMLIDWGDGCTTTVDPATSPWTQCHQYATPGVYQVKVTVADSYGESDNATCAGYIAVYDPTDGFVTGSGNIWSPPGAYTPYPDVQGWANFGFVARYRKGATTPTGQTEFQLHLGQFGAEGWTSMSFHSTLYAWLVVAGAQAKFKGEGTINGGGNYGFMVSAVDGQLPGGGGIDKLRMKIWDKDAGDVVVYDNQLGAPDDEAPVAPVCDGVGGGTIVIHKGN